MVVICSKILNLGRCQSEMVLGSKMLDFVYGVY